MDRNHFVQKLLATVFALALLMSPLAGLDRPARADTASEVLLPSALVGEGYTTPLVSAALQGKATFAFAQGSSLPDGLHLEADGTVSGVPTQPGTYTFGVMVKTEAFTVENVYRMQVEPFRVVTQYLKPVTPGQPYSDVIRVKGNGTRHFVLTEGDLPAGLSLNEDTGELTGTVEVWEQDVSFAISVAQGGENRTVRYTLTQADQPLAILGGDSLANQAAGRPFALDLGLQGGSGTYGFRISGDGLQDMVIDQIGATLQLSCSGTSAQIISLYVEAWDEADPANMASKVLSFQVLQALTVTGVNPSAQTTVGQQVSWQIQTNKNGSSSKRFVLADGDLPEGLILDGNTGLITGASQVTGYFTVGIRVYDPNVPGLDGFGSITGQVAEGMQILPETLPSSIESVPLQIQGGVAPYTLSILSVDTTILGAQVDAAQADGSFVLHMQAGSLGSITLRAEDAMGAVTERTYTLVEKILEIQAGSLPVAAVNQYYDSGLFITSNTVGVTYTAQGLPQGLTIDTGGQIKGTPQISGSYPVVITGVCAEDGTSDQVQITLRVTGSTDVRKLIPVSGIRSAYWDASSKQWVLEMDDVSTTAVFALDLADPAASVVAEAPGTYAAGQISLPVNQDTAVMRFTVTSADGTSQQYTAMAARQATSLQITGLPGSVKVGDIFTLDVKAQPDGARLGPITWEYNASALRHSGSNPAKFEALKSGSFDITAKTRDALGKTLTVNLNVHIEAQATASTPKPNPPVLEPKETAKPSRRPSSAATPTPEPTQTPDADTPLLPAFTGLPETTVTPAPSPTPETTDTPEVSPTPLPEDEEDTPESKPTPVPEKPKKGLPIWVWPLVIALVILVPSVIVVVVKEVTGRRDKAIVGDGSQEDVYYSYDNATNQEPIAPVDDTHDGDTDGIFMDDTAMDNELNQNQSSADPYAAPNPGRHSRKNDQ